MRRLLLLALCLAGCGGGASSLFDGTYSGSLAFSNNCGGQSSHTNPMVSLKLTQSGTSVTIEGLGCSGFTGAIDGSDVNLASHTCPADAKGNKLGFTGGSLTVSSDGTAVVDLFNSDTLANGTTCSGTLAGQLTKVSGGQAGSWNPY